MQRDNRTSIRGETILSALLQELGVRYTPEYADSLFRAMPFKTLFGLKNALRQYGIESSGFKLGDKREILSLDTPYIASAGERYVVVSSQNADSVEYISEGVHLSIPTDRFIDDINPIVFQAYPNAGSIEPKYSTHRLKELMVIARDLGIAFSALVLFIWMFVSSDLCAHPSLIAAAIFYIAGITFSWMLVQKTNGIHTKASSKVCGVLQKEGCDHILSLKASTFLGIFHWSEVGLSYFCTSLIFLLVNPELAPELALLNICCLPYTVWSITYQKFKAHAWCTLCVSVQATLWILFICFLCGGWIPEAFPLSPALIPMALTYILVCLALNRLDAYIDRLRSKAGDKDSDL